MDTITDHPTPARGERWGQYRIERVLGSGGMGSVVAAHDERLDRPVALELVQGRSGDAPLREALAALSHPNIVHIEGVERFGGRVFVVMERIRGRSVRDVLAEAGRLSPEAALEIVRAVAAALEAVHRSGRIHGDVKPSNILIEDETGRVLLSGFGLSRPIDERESRARLRGAPDYVPPERARGIWMPDELRARQDVYSLAATAFHLLTGRAPFEVGDARTLLRRHAYEEPPRPSAFRPALSWRVDRALLAGLKKRPEERTATPGMLARALERAFERGHAPPRILIADDDPDHRQLVALGLSRRLGRIVVESAPDGESAYRAATERTPDVAVLDLDMPGLNGLELAVALRSTPGLERLPIVVVSGCLRPQERAALGRVGVDRCFDKPVILGRLANAVRELAEMRGERGSGRHPILGGGRAGRMLPETG